MPAGKTKSAAGANGFATSKPVSRSGTATPVSTIGQKDVVEAVATLALSRPDKNAYDNEQAAFKSEIDGLQSELNVVRDKINASSPGASNDRRNDLLSQLNELKANQSTGKSSRDKVKEQITLKQDAIKKLTDSLKAAKAKIPFRTLVEVEAHIQNLEKQVESGSLKLADEKRALAEISSTKRSRRTVEGFQADQTTIENLRAEIDELRKEYDDPESKALDEKYKSIKAELDAIRKEGDDVAATRRDLFQKRDAIQAQLKDLYSKKRESGLRYKDQNDRYYTKIQEDRTRRAERARLQKAAEESQKKKELAERLLEEAQAPAFQAYIEDCQTLIDYFSGKSTGTVTYKTQETTTKSKAELPGVAKLDLRKVDDIPEGSIVRKKKGEDEDSYFVVAKGKGKGKKAPAAKVDTPPAPSTTTSSSSLNVPLPTLSALLSMSIPPPTSSADVPRVIEDLNTKKTWYEANQARVTSENIAKAQKEILRLTGGEPKPAAAAPDSLEPPSPSQADDTRPEEASSEPTKADS